MCSENMVTIVGCSQRKIWDTQKPYPQSAEARLAYIGPLFKSGARIAQLLKERYDIPWYILSAKYGLIEPTKLITNYNVSFVKKSTNPITCDQLKQQQIPIQPRATVIVLAGRLYCDMLQCVLANKQCNIITPIYGLKIGYAMARLKALYKYLLNSNLEDWLKQLNKKDIYNLNVNR